MDLRDGIPWDDHALLAAVFAPLSAGSPAPVRERHRAFWEAAVDRYVASSGSPRVTVSALQAFYTHPTLGLRPSTAALDQVLVALLADGTLQHPPRPPVGLLQWAVDTLQWVIALPWAETQPQHLVHARRLDDTIAALLPDQDVPKHELLVTRSVLADRLAAAAPQDAELLKAALLQRGLLHQVDGETLKLGSRSVDKADTAAAAVLRALEACSLAKEQSMARIRAEVPRPVKLLALKQIKAIEAKEHNCWKLLHEMDKAELNKQIVSAHEESNKTLKQYHKEAPDVHMLMEQVDETLQEAQSVDAVLATPLQDTVLDQELQDELAQIEQEEERPLPIFPDVPTSTAIAMKDTVLL